MSGSSSRRGGTAGCLVVAAAALLAAPAAVASSLSGDTLAKVADALAIFVIILVPIVGVTVFWLVHILPEKFAHKRNHPQAQAIQVLCLLSLLFGGLLWPIAMLWAFTKPVLYRLAYGTDQGTAHGVEPAGEDAMSEAAMRLEVSKLKADLDRLAASPSAPPELESIREQLAALEPRLAAGEAR